MMRIDDVMPLSVLDLQTALKGFWGVQEGDTVTDVSLGAVTFRMYSGGSAVVPVQYRKGTQDLYAKSLAIIAFSDGTSVTEALSAPKSYGKEITMGVLIARQI